MKKLSILLVFISACIAANAQSDSAMEKLMTRRILYADDITYNCSYLVPQYYNSGKLDELKNLMDYWERKCGKVEPLVSFQILYAIKSGSFNESLYDANMVRYLLAYKDNYTGKDTSMNYYYGLHPVDGSYYEFLSAMANSMRSQKGLTATEQVLVDFYATRDLNVLNKLDSSAYNNTVLQQSFDKVKKQRNGLNNYGGGLFAGVWVPNGNLQLLGVHPDLGADLFVRSQRFVLGMDMQVRFLKSASSYQVYSDNVQKTTNYFSSVSLGATAGYAVVQTEKSELLAIGGVEYDALYQLKSTTDNDSYNGKYIASLNLNAGMEYRYYYNGYDYLGLQAKYNQLFYNNAGGTNLSGGAVLVGLVWGGFDRPLHKTNALD